MRQPISCPSPGKFCPVVRCTGQSSRWNSLYRCPRGVPVLMPGFLVMDFAPKDFPAGRLFPSFQEGFSVTLPQRIVTIMSRFGQIVYFFGNNTKW
jgi:hypothetical protein